MADSLDQEADGPERMARYPTFVRELEGTLAVHSQYVLYGNIRDNYLMPGPPGGPPRVMKPLLDLLWEALRPSGYRCLLYTDQVHGLGVHPDLPEAREVATEALGDDVLGTAPPLLDLRRYLARVSGTAEPSHGGERRRGSVTLVPQRPRVAFVVGYASRLVQSPANLQPVERDFFLHAQKLAETAYPVPGGPPERPGAVFNPVIWLVDGERDLPSWLPAGSERIRTIGVPLPDLADRRAACEALAATLEPAESTPVERNHREFADRTGGMTLRSMIEITRLARDRRMTWADISDAVRIYKLGIEDNFWRRSHIRTRIQAGEETIFRSRVKGQEQAIRKTLDILKRAALGLSGAQAKSPGSRPRGVMFFAGPTGVGKTELAKTIAEVLFGSEDAYLRFDMSEFSAEHAADRLIGAPPGYVGFEAGGELTRAVRQQPFRVVLFDEIEKAHPLVMDKFLQILEDGRLTDGQGVTTYFSECVLVFTSNLGVLTEDKDGTKRVEVDPGTPYEELEVAVKRAIKDHFTKKIGRPELLNRLGDNIVVFDYITAAAAEEIFDLQIDNIRNAVRRSQRLDLQIHPAVLDTLRERCTSKLEYGGRGIGNALESALINPVARALFDQKDDPEPDSTVLITAIDPGPVDTTVTLKILPKEEP
jgi:MoxR-like ATPase